MKNSHPHNLETKTALDPFSFSPEQRRKMIAHYVESCPFLGEYLTSDELIAIIQGALNENRIQKKGKEKVNLHRNEKITTFQCKIEDSSLSESIKTALRRSEIIYIGDLCTKNKWQIQGVQGIGYTRMREIRKLLATLDVSFGLDTEFWNQTRPGGSSYIQHHSGTNEDIQQSSKNTILSLLNGGK